jgi:hypothetical protein
LTTEETSGEEEIQLLASIQSDSQEADAQGILETNSQINSILYL